MILTMRGTKTPLTGSLSNRLDCCGYTTMFHSKTGNRTGSTRTAHNACRRRVEELRIKSERFMKKETVSTFVSSPRRAAPLLHHWPKLPKHNTNKTNRQRPQRLCGIYPRTHKVALHQRPKHNTNKSRQRPQRFMRNLPTTPTKSRCTTNPNTTQTTDPATAATILRNLPTTATRCCTIGQTRHKQHNPAKAATIVRNLPTTPKVVRAAPPTQTRHKQQTRQRPQRLCRIFARWLAKSQRDKTS